MKISSLSETSLVCQLLAQNQCHLFYWESLSTLLNQLYLSIDIQSIVDLRDRQRMEDYRSKIGGKSSMYQRKITDLLNNTVRNESIYFWGILLSSNFVD